MSSISYPPPLGDGVPAPAANVPESDPNAPPDVVVPGNPPTSIVSGLSSTERMLQNVLGVDSPQEGLPAQNAVVSISAGLPSSALQVFTFE
jgi:hypothetical protein